MCCDGEKGRLDQRPSALMEFHHIQSAALYGAGLLLTHRPTMFYLVARSGASAALMISENDKFLYCIPIPRASLVCHAPEFKLALYACLHGSFLSIQKGCTWPAALISLIRHVQFIDSLFTRLLWSSVLHGGRRYINPEPANDNVLRAPPFHIVGF